MLGTHDATQGRRSPGYNVPSGRSTLAVACGMIKRGKDGLLISWLWQPGRGAPPGGLSWEGLSDKAPSSPSPFPAKPTASRWRQRLHWPVWGTPQRCPSCAILMDHVSNVGPGCSLDTARPFATWETTASGLGTHRQVGPVPLDQISQAVEQPAPVRGVHAAPGRAQLESSPGSLHRLVHVFLQNTQQDGAGLLRMIASKCRPPVAKHSPSAGKAAQASTRAPSEELQTSATGLKHTPCSLAKSWWK